MDAENLNPVLESVRCLIAEGDIEEKDLATFEDFWAEIDVINAYEDDWEDIEAEQNKYYWKPYYEETFRIIKGEHSGKENQKTN